MNDSADDTLLNFAYGSNLATTFVRQYCPSATFVMRAQLPNYEVQFRFYSEPRQGGISTIIETPGALVHGVIYRIDRREIEELDVIERLHLGLYKREPFLVHGEDGAWHTAELYRVTTPDGPFPAAKSYVDQMIEGAREHGLDAAYTQKLVDLRRSLD